MKFSCKHCQGFLVCEDDWAGATVECPSCGKRIQVPEANSGNTKTQRRIQRRKHQWADNANIPVWGSLGIAFGFFVLFYLLVWPMHKIYFGQLFLHRGWVPFVLVFLMGWSFGILLLKQLKLNKQKAAMILDALPSELGEVIDESNVEDFIEHVDKLPARLQGSFLVNRVRRGLEHFWTRRSNPEVADLMRSQSDIDASAIQGSYTMVKIFIWAIPILGFIGTVIGISAAISSFSGSLDQAEDMTFLINSINQVTQGLGVAFDTTLIALVMSLIVSFPAGSLQKAEEDLLNRIDEYCNENLLKRLDDAGGVADVAQHTQTIMDNIGSAVTDSQKEILEGLQDLVEQMAEVQGAQAEQTGSLGKTLEHQVDALSLRAAEHQQHLDARVAELVKGVEGRAGASFQKQADDAKTYFDGLREGIEALNGVLKQLDQKQVVIQVQQPEKRGWFRRKK